MRSIIRRQLPLGRAARLRRGETVDARAGPERRVRQHRAAGGAGWKLDRVGPRRAVQRHPDPQRRRGRGDQLERDE